MFYDSKMFKDALLSFTFIPVHPSPWTWLVRAALPWSTIPGYHGPSISGRAAGRRQPTRFLPPFPVQGLPSGRCIVN
jgi:hypothetical protein